MMNFAEDIRQFLTSLFGDVFILTTLTILFVTALLLFTRSSRYIELQLTKTTGNGLVVKRIRKFLTRFRKAVFYTASLLICIFVGAGAYYIAEGDSLYLALENLVLDHAFSEWTSLGNIGAKVVIIFILLPIISRWLRKTLKYFETRAKQFDQITSNDHDIEIFFNKLRFILTLGIWYGAIIVALQLINVPAYLIDVGYLLLRIYFIISVGFLIVSGTDVLVASLDALSVKYAHRNPMFKNYHEIRPMMPLLRRCLEYALYIYVATLVLQQLSLTSVADYGPKLVQVIGIFFFARVLLELARIFIRSVLIKDGKAETDEDQRRLTTAPIASSVAKYGIYFVAIILIMRTLEIDATPILAGAGIVGLIVGFGAQPLINDIVSGFFILFENLYLVGDYIETGSARGIVEAIDIRTTRIRDPDGQQHILRNGQIGEIINYSKGYANAVVMVGIDYQTNLDEAYAVISRVGEACVASHQDVLEKTRVDGLETFGDSSLVIRTVTKVRPGKHLSVARHLRKMLKEAFDEAHIEIPFPRRVIFMRDENKPVIPAS